MPKKIHIPDQVPLTQNAALRRHWSFRPKERKRWAQLVLQTAGPGPWFGAESRARHKPRKAHVRIFVGRPIKVQDTDNAWASVKPVLDGLRTAGWIWDDGVDWCFLEVEEAKVKRPGWVHITIAEYREDVKTLKETS